MAVHPTIIIGLGPEGARVAGAALEHVVERTPSLAPFFDALVLDGHGVGRLARSGEGEVMEEDVYEWETPLDEEVASGVWRVNYETLTASRRVLERAIGKAVRRTRGFQRAGQGEMSGVGSALDIYLVGGSATPTASAAVFPLLDAIERVKKASLQNVACRVHLLLLSPDLLDESDPLDDERSRLTQARSYVFFQELEWAREHVEGMSKPDHVWLLTGQNEKGFFATGLEDVLEAAVHFLGAAMRGEAMGDRSFGVALSQRTGGKRRGYSSFGYARLSYPRVKLVEALTDSALGKVMADLPVLAEVEVPAGEVFADVQTFIQELELNGLPKALEQDTEGRSIFKTLSLPQPARWDEQAMEVATEREAAYEMEAFPEMQRALVNRWKSLFEEHRSTTLKRVGVLLDRKKEGGLFAARAWLAAFEGRPSPFISGDTEDFPETLGAIEGHVKDHFDHLFEPILFDEDDEDVAAYVAQNPGARGRRRRVLRAVRLDLSTKQRILEEQRAQLAHMEAEEASGGAAEVKDVAPSRHEGNTGDSSEGEFLSDDSERDDVETPDAEMDVAEGMRNDEDVLGDEDDFLEEINWDDEEATEPPVVSAAEGQKGALRSEIDTAEDAALRQAGGASARQRAAEARAQRKAEVLDNIENYKAEVEWLGDLEAHLARQVARLDRTISDAAERRHLLAAVSEEAETRKQQEKEGYVERVKNYRTARQELAAFQEGHLSALLKAAGVGLVASLALGGYFYFSLPEGFKWLEAVALVALWAVVAGGYYLVDYKREELRLREAMSAAEEAVRAQYARVGRVMNSLLNERFKHLLYSALVDWKAELSRFLRALDRDLERFGRTLTRKAESALAVADPAGSKAANVRELWPKGGLEKLWTEGADEVRLAVADYWKEHPLSRLFVDSRVHEAGSGMDSLLEGLSVVIRGVFERRLDPDLQSFLAREVPREGERKRMFEELLHRAAPFASRSAMAYLDGEPESLVFVAVPPRSELLKEAFQAQEGNVQYAVSVPHEVMAIRLTVGLAAFELASVIAARAALEDADEGLRDEVALSETWVGSDEDLVPSVVTMGGADDAHREAACLALAYQIAVADGEAVRFNGQTHTGYADWVQHLKGTGGYEDYQRVREELSARRENGEGDVAEHLERFMTRPRLDAVDKAIVENELHRWVIK